MCVGGGIPSRSILSLIPQEQKLVAEGQKRKEKIDGGLNEWARNARRCLVAFFVFFFGSRRANSRKCRMRRTPNLVVSQNSQGRLLHPPTHPLKPAPAYVTKANPSTSRPPAAAPLATRSDQTWKVVPVSFSLSAHSPPAASMSCINSSRALVRW